MAGLPHYTYQGKSYPPAPSSEPPHCSCHNNPVITRHQCPRCINHPNVNVRWDPPSGSNNRFPVTNPYPGNHGSVTNPNPGNIGFQPSAPYPPNGAVYHNNNYPPHLRPTNPSRPTFCHRCSASSCVCHGHGQENRPRPVISSATGAPRGGVKPYYWVDTFARGGVPSTALRGGHDIDGTQIFVGRAFHEGDWIPAKVIPEKQVAYVAYNGVEHAKDQYQVLCEQRFDWVPSSGGHVPAGAVEGGKTSDGETLYVGRVHHDGAITVGKIHPSHGVCYVPFDGREVGHGSYEILILRS